jgi:surface carbohydrate biosynthesis protein
VKKYNLGIIVDNPLRDLAGSILLAYELSNNNVDCYLIPMNLVDKELWVLDIDFLLMNYVRTANSRFISKLIKANIDFGILDTEGGVIDMESFFQSIGDKKLSSKASLYCSWGSFQATELCQRGYYKKKNTLVTNNPRLDFYNESFIKNEISRLPEKFLNSEYILINTAFTIYNPKFKSIEREKKMYINYFGRTKEEINDKINAEKIAIRELISLIKKISNIYPNLNFILRPHPFEGLKLYQDAFRNYVRVDVIQEDTVVKWIAGAKGVINYNCSTSYEAGLLGVPSFFPSYFQNIKPIEQIFKTSIMCYSEADLLEKIKLLLNGGNVFPDNYSNDFNYIQNKWFMENDGNAHARVAESVLSKINSSQNLSKIARLNLIYSKDFMPKANFKKNIKNLLRYVFRIPYGHSILKRNDENQAVNKWKKSSKFYDVKIAKSIITGIHQVKKGVLPFVVNISNNHTDVYKQKLLRTLKIYC